MATKDQAEQYARQTAWALRQTMHVVVRAGAHFAASPLDVRRMGGEIVATFKPRKGRAGARKTA